MAKAPHGERLPSTILLKGEFSPKLRTYFMAYWTALIACTIVGIVMLPVWLVLGPILMRKYHATLRCELTEREVVVGKGLIFRREVTIPLDKIQDISIHEGPLLTAFGLLRLRLETAGQSNAGTGRSDADLIGLTKARVVRDRILAQRDVLSALNHSASAKDPSQQLLTEIRDSLLRLEDRLAAAAAR
jgi:membrane protein YdbS with pleckstrin-like domain